MLCGISLKKILYGQNKKLTSYYLVKNQGRSIILSIIKINKNLNIVLYFLQIILHNIKIIRASLKIHISQYAVYKNQ